MLKVSKTASSRLVLLAGRLSLEGIEDEVKACLELVAVLEARLQDVRGGHLGQVRIIVGPRGARDLPRDLGGLFLAAERQARLLQGEPVSEPQVASAATPSSSPRSSAAGARPLPALTEE